MTTTALLCSERFPPPLFLFCKTLRPPVQLWSFDGGDASLCKIILDNQEAPTSHAVDPQFSIALLLKRIQIVLISTFVFPVFAHTLVHIRISILGICMFFPTLSSLY
jgi:hypothetical protein